MSDTPSATARARAQALSACAAEPDISAPASPENDAAARRAALRDSIGETMRAGVQLKRAMLKRGLRGARAVCPRCGGNLLGYLCNHMRMACDGCDGCDIAMME